jgi:hypothetical protein
MQFTKLVRKHGGVYSLPAVASLLSFSLEPAACCRELDAHLAFEKQELTVQK